MTTPLTLRLHRVLQHPPRVVFDAWLSAEALLAWWMPPGGRCTRADVDPTVGGRYVLVNEFEDGERAEVSGQFLGIERPNHLRMTWRINETPEELVNIRFSEHPQGCLLELQHERIAGEQSLAQHERGWHACLDGLDAFLDQSP